MSTDQLAAFVPAASDPFDRRKAAHLLRRSGFGASAAEIQKAIDRGLLDTVEGLFAEAEDEHDAFTKTFEAIAGSLLGFAEAENLQAWRLYRMVRTRVPLREKLTLFWHGHFATSYHKVESMRLMHQQIETLRQHAWGNVRELVLAMAKDPAMLVWLDGESSTKEHPNENFARELMELFTCGIGHYNEHDVQEAARAFTGWHRAGAEFRFVAEAHDDGPKDFLGKSGRFDGTDIVDILMQQPATTHFLARKLLRFFATPEPSEDVVAEAAELLDRTQLNIKWFLRELFLSRYFYSDACVGRRISSPVEFVVGTIRTLGARWPATELTGHLNAMGQELLAPPNVKGWDGERTWINSTTWAARLAFAKAVSELASDDGFGAHLALEQIIAEDQKDPRTVVDALVEWLIPEGLPQDHRRELADFLITTDDGRNAETFRDDDDFRHAKIRALVALLLSLPEAHAC
jgi:uncharacterized protein (DUF1800 family)